MRLMSAAGLLWLAVAGAAAAQDLAVSGRVEHPATMDLAALQALPAVTVEVVRPTDKGPVTQHFTGALLWAVLRQAGPIDENGPRTRLQHMLLARGRDGYAVAIAVGELDPDFEGKQVLVAYAQDGAPLPALRLVVPADMRAGRSVRDLVAVEVR